MSTSETVQLPTHIAAWLATQDDASKAMLATVPPAMVIMLAEASLENARLREEKARQERQNARLLKVVPNKAGGHTIMPTMIGRAAGVEGTATLNDRMFELLFGDSDPTERDDILADVTSPEYLNVLTHKQADITAQKAAGTYVTSAQVRKANEAKRIEEEAARLAARVLKAKQFAAD